MARSKGFGDRFPVHESEVLDALARNVRRLRKKRNWTQDELAAAAGIEQTAVSLIENRRSNPTVQIIEKVASALGVAFVELFSSRSRP